VSLPEVPLLGVLPGTGGLTRLTDKRKVRRDLADVFCSTSEGVRADRARQWKLVDHIVRPQLFATAVRERAQALAAQSSRTGTGAGIALTPLARTIDKAGYPYENVDAAIDRKARTATLTVAAPRAPQPRDLAGIHAAGARWWPLQTARELDDAILMLRTNDLDIGSWILKTRGSADAALACDAALRDFADDWFVRETRGFLRRTLARLEVSSRTLFAIVDPGSCFAGTLAELVFAADRSYMLQLPGDDAPTLSLSDMNFDPLPMVNGLSRLANRFCAETGPVEAARAQIGKRLDAAAAAELGLITYAPDDIDWNEEVRLALEERTSLSPDALTGMEANLRFTGPETMHTRIFGRLTAWQNWIFNRPNAVGEHGALKVFGTGSKAKFDWERV
jgi:benzoyl-CoA-dihydrodiol lyase